MRWMKKRSEISVILAAILVVCLCGRVAAETYGEIYGAGGKVEVEGNIDTKICFKGKTCFREVINTWNKEWNNPHWLRDTGCDPKVAVSNDNGAFCVTTADDNPLYLKWKKNIRIDKEKVSISFSGAFNDGTEQEIVGDCLKVDEDMVDVFEKSKLSYVLADGKEKEVEVDVASVREPIRNIKKATLKTEQMIVRFEFDSVPGGSWSFNHEPEKKWNEIMFMLHFTKSKTPQVQWATKIAFQEIGQK